ncbi:MFS transporter [Streptomyces sp. NBC_01456]|uniref:MFS transporter n=1 Tax=unclassified Streptomyces TaxID=2593676 RepID=UPI002E3055ED|nr:MULTISPECIES: MFS transporter [unclassified Streptomyces]
MTSTGTEAAEDQRRHARPSPEATLITSCLAVCLAQIALAMPATLNGLFQESLHPVGSQLTWISDAFLLPVTVLELAFGLLGDLFGRKRLLIGGAGLLAAGEVVAATAGGVAQLWAGQLLGGLGAAALFPTTLVMVAAGTHTPRDRAQGIAVWTASAFDDTTTELDDNGQVVAGLAVEREPIPCPAENQATVGDRTP